MPLRRVQLGTKLQRSGIALHHPAQRFQRHAGIGQRRHIAVAELPRVGMTGFFGDARMGLYQGDSLAVAYQRPGCGQADYAATDNGNMLGHR